MIVFVYLPKLKRGLRLAFGDIFCMIVPYLILYLYTKFQRNTFFSSQDIKQNVLLIIIWTIDDITDFEIFIVFEALSFGEKIKNKFGFLSSKITKYVDTMLLLEKKLDDSFPIAQFSLNGFSQPYRLDRSSHGGGILLYVRDDRPLGLLTDYKIKDDVESFFLEVNMWRKKWLLGCPYNSHKSNISSHLHHLNKGLHVYMKSYDNIF